jgi:hypothetical protein
MMAKEDRADVFLGVVLIGSYFGKLIMEEKDGVLMAKESDSMDDE